MIKNFHSGKNIYTQTKNQELFCNGKINKISYLVEEDCDISHIASILKGFPYCGIRRKCQKNKIPEAKATAAA